MEPHEDHCKLGKVEQADVEPGQIRGHLVCNKSASASTDNCCDTNRWRPIRSGVVRPWSRHLHGHRLVDAGARQTNGKVRKSIYIAPFATHAYSQSAQTDMWPWPWIGSYCTPSCIIRRPLPTYQISLKSKKVFCGRMDGHLRPALLGRLGVDLIKLAPRMHQNLTFWAQISKTLCEGALPKPLPQWNSAHPTPRHPRAPHSSRLPWVVPHFLNCGYARGLLEGRKEIHMKIAVIRMCV